MTPTAFTFKLTVPSDPEGGAVVAIMAGHAVEYAGIDAAERPAFVERVRATAQQALTGCGPAGCLCVFAAADGNLTVTINGQSISHPLPA